MVHIRTPWVFQDLVNELDRMTRDAGRFFGPAAGALDASSGGLDVRGDEAELTLELPGVREEDLELVLENSTLRIEASRSDAHAESEEVVLRERTYGEFQREYRLPWPVDEKETKAGFERGVLHLSLKRAPEAAPRKIEVRSA